MSIRFIVPWQIQLHGMKSGSPRSGHWWRRKHFKQPHSVPLRSVTMKEDDLNHLGSLHKVIVHRVKQ